MLGIQRPWPHFHVRFTDVFVFFSSSGAVPVIKAFFVNERKHLSAFLFLKVNLSLTMQYCVFSYKYTLH